MNAVRAATAAVVALMAMTALSACGRSSAVGEGIAERLLGQLSSGDRAQAVAMFHVPESYSPEEVAADRRTIGESLAILEEEFGRLELYRPTRTAAPFAEVGIGGGDGAYWGRFPGQATLLYEARFSNIGPGYVKVRLRQIDEGWALQAVEYGVPLSKPGAKETVDRVFRRVMGTM